MARESLFKGKSKKSGKWYEGAYFYGPRIWKLRGFPCSEDPRYHFILTPDGGIIEIDIKTRCEYSGVTDKNGNRIWEGDVFEYRESKERFVVRHGTYTHSNTEFENTNIGFYADWQIETTMRKDLLFWVNHRDINLIGNIFENPELLEGGGENAN